MIDQIIIPQVIDMNQRDWISQAHRNLPFWTCKNQCFTSILPALLYAQEQKSHLEVYWNDHYLDQFDFSVEPPESIEFWYKERAQQLRDTYDYIVISYSGGSDSSTILKTFLKNNIKIDEVLTYAVWSSKVDGTKDTNNLEIKIAAWPMLQELEKRGIKINYTNYFDYIEGAFDDQDWIFNSDPTLLAYNEFKTKMYFQPHLRKMVAEGKKVCVITGHDKPRVVVKDRAFYHCYLDVGMLCTNIRPELFTRDWDWGAYEYFYSNIDVPALMIKQGHMIARWYWNTFGENCTNLLNTKSYDPWYSKRANKVVYASTWDEDHTYSLGKFNLAHGNLHLYRSEFVTEGLDGTHYKTNFLGGVDRVFKMLEPRFKSPDGKRIGGHWTKMRKIMDFPTSPII